MTHHPDQLGFGDLLAAADQANADRVFAKETKHLPDTWDEAVSFHRQHIEDHHAATLACDFDRALDIRQDARLLAKKLNGGDPGILAHDDAPGCRLERATTATEGAVPLWGQKGVFDVSVCDMRCQITMQGLFGIGASMSLYLGFEARAVDGASQFVSSTGYRSFLGCSIQPEAGVTPAGFASRVIAMYVERDLKGKLVRLQAQPMDGPARIGACRRS